MLSNKLKRNEMKRKIYNRQQGLAFHRARRRGPAPIVMLGECLQEVCFFLWFSKETD